MAGRVSAPFGHLLPDVSRPTGPEPGKAYDAGPIWSRPADDGRSVELPRGAHLPHEERPAEVDRHPLDFPRGWDG